ncbi:MAG: IS1595 family transposase [Bacteroidota bacterium]|nr:IS1595 family transposase [Bacteroidota bacterium]
MKKYSDESKCRELLIQQRWNGNPECPKCGSKKYYNIDNGKRFKCANNKCYYRFTVTIGTVFEASNIPLSTWFPAMYLIASHKKGISSVQLAKDLGVTQKTAWFMLHRIRESLKEKNSPLLSGIVEIDETYMSRKYASDYKGMSPEAVERMEQSDEYKKKRNLGAVIGMKAREGKIIVKASFKADAKSIAKEVKENVATNAMLMTDESLKYKKSLAEYERQSVNHSKREWVRGNVHTNGVENFWSVMKRGIYGIYHQISYKHLQRYCDEFSYRYNSRDINDGNRFELTLQRIEGRLTYKQLVNGKDTSEEKKA